MRNKCSLFFVVLTALVLMASCYSDHPKRSAALLNAPAYSERQLDSISFYSTHHYTENFNFVVKADSLLLISQQPEEEMSDLQTDSFAVRRHARVVVADIRMMPNDSIDSVWVELGTEDARFGWIHESQLLPHVVPDDPISQFISVFSDVHLLIFLIIVVIIGFLYTMRKLLRRKAHIVHFRDISSFYPTALCLLVASSATLYATIQNFEPEMWRHFYFHPTLNPFSVPVILAIFLVCVWAMFIVALAAAEDVYRQLPLADAALYLCGLAAVCAVNYVIFSIMTLYYVGYVLLALYFFVAIRRYFRDSLSGYYCGHCGAKMRQKGRCPRCGALNE